MAMPPRPSSSSTMYRPPTLLPRASAANERRRLRTTPGGDDEPFDPVGGVGAMSLELMPAAPMVARLVPVAIDRGGVSGGPSNSPSSASAILPRLSISERYDGPMSRS